MNRFLQFLIRATRSVDGNSGTANFLIEAATLSEIQRQERRIHRNQMRRRRSCVIDEHESWSDYEVTHLTEEQKERIKEEKTSEILRQTFFKYLMMRVRTKISYYAFRKQMTINEFIIDQIARSYSILKYKQEIPATAAYTSESLKLFEELFDAPIERTVSGLMQLNRDPVVIKRKGQFYKLKEINNLGGRNLEDFDEKIQRGIQLLMMKNSGHVGEDKDHQIQGDSERRPFLRQLSPLR